MARRTDLSCRAGSPNPAKRAQPAHSDGRKHLRRLDRIFSDLDGPIYFLTCCVDDRKPVLACDAAVAVLVAAWETSPDVYGWAVGRYVVMPDHVHFFATSWREDAKDLSEFIASWKRWTRNRMRKQCGPTFSWQPEFFDHVLRSSESYSQKWEYVRMNPVRAALVGDADNWPYQGELVDLAW